MKSPEQVLRDIETEEPRVMHVLPNLEVGGTQKVVLDLIDHLPDIEMAVAAVTTGGEYQHDFEERVPTTLLADEEGDPHRSYLWFKPGPIRALARAIKEHRANIVQTHTYPAAIVGRTAAKLAGVPVIVDTLHNTYHWKQPRDLGIDRFLARWTDEIVCVSEGVRSYAIDQNPGIPSEKFSVIHNGVDVSRYYPRGNRNEVRARLGISPSELVVGAVGRLVKQKRARDLIEAAPGILNQFPNAKFLVVGDGPLASQVAEDAANRGVEESVIFTGTVHDTENIYPALDVFAQLADREGFGLTLVEAMASRTAVVAAKSAPIPEIVDHGRNGMVFEIGDVRALESHIVTLFGDDELRSRLGSEAERDVQLKFSIPNTAANYRSLYHDLVIGRLGAMNRSKRSRTYLRHPSNG